MANAIKYTSSREANARVGMARIAAAGRVQAERLAREKRDERLYAEGQTSDDMYDWCFICSRPTNHFGEHSDEQIAAWRSRSKTR